MSINLKNSNSNVSFQKALPPNLYQQVTTSHPYRFAGPYRASADEVKLDSRWSINLHDSCGPLSRLAADDLAGLLRQTFSIKPAKRSGVALTVRIERNTTSPRESYRLIVDDDSVEIIATDDEGAMRALFHLGRQMLNRRAPMLSKGEFGRRPQWDWRITSPILHNPIDQPGDYLKLPREYLLNMARYGYNATFLFMNWFDLMTPDIAGELARPDWRQRQADLQRSANYLGEFGIRLLFHVSLLAQPADHPLFMKSTRLRGAQTWMKGMHCLCSSSPAVLELIRQSSHQLFNDVPSLAGAVLIVGGECYLHCYTRPFPKPASGTNCPHCAKISPDRVVAGFSNAFVEGAIAAKPDAQVMVWPYSAFTWGDAKTQSSMISQLHPSTACLTAFAKDGWINVDGVRSYVFDYSISHMGPSSLFESTRKASLNPPRKMLARTETSQCIEMFNIPRIPIMQRWAERYHKLRNSNLDGVHTAWRFYGFAAQRTDEIVDYFNWDQNPEVGRLLNTLAARDFSPAAARPVVRAWNQFSEAFSKFPYSGGITGFPYFRGPFSIGPAHPFVFDLSAPMGLSAEFWAVDPCMEEGFTDTQRIEATRQPRFFTDLTWTQPFGGQIMQRRMGEIDRQWQRGVKLLDSARPTTNGTDRKRLDEEIGISRLIGCMFRTAFNLAHFQNLRQKVTAVPCTLKQLRSTCLKAMDVLMDELRNSQVALKTTRNDPSLGYGATYGYAFTAQLIEEKIRHTQQEILEKVPWFYHIYAFHMFGVHETLPIPDLEGSAVKA
ncbi:MAG: hypothetical protein IT447_12580 [Phycisphaerales bacterium]|jgi:hypothetical protein|nr:hypothetical protein [Phycisphaerales bacterium]